MTTYLGFPGGSVVKNLPAMQEAWVQSLDGEDPLEKEMATLPGKSWGQRNLAGCSPWGHKIQTRLSDETTTTNTLLRL